MGDLKPLAFDIETSGLSSDSVITVAGFCTEVGSWLVLNTGGESADPSVLSAEIENRSSVSVRVAVRESERMLLDAVTEHTKRINTDAHYLTAYNGETWNSGFDLPFLRRSCVRHDADWPFPDIAYADVMSMLQRVDTNDVNDLDGVYDILIGNAHCDPFDDSGEAVSAFENGDWTELLLHNLADIRRTRQLAALAERYVAKSDFRMKNLSPPNL